MLVVPLPANGSKTVSPTIDQRVNMRFGISVGNGAGCQLFLAILIDQISLAHSLNCTAVILLVVRSFMVKPW